MIKLYYLIIRFNRLGIMNQTRSRILPSVDFSITILITRFWFGKSHISSRQINNGRFIKICTLQCLCQQSPQTTHVGNDHTLTVNIFRMIVLGVLVRSFNQWNSTVLGVRKLATYIIESLSHNIAKWLKLET